MFSATAKWSWISGLTCSAAAIGLFCAPPTVTCPLRTSVRDILVPGQQLANVVINRVCRVIPRYANVTRLQTQLERVSGDLEDWQAYARRLQSDVASLREQVAEATRSGPAPIAATSEPPLMIADLLQAHILGRESSDRWRSGQLIDLGRSHGIRESAIVLDSSEPLLDQGTSTRVAPGQPVYSGRCVVGKTHHVGQWTSTVLPIHDPEYRGFAQLMRRADAADVTVHRTNAISTGDNDATWATSGNIVFGAQGILEGTGTELCRLTLIPSTEPVNIGDDVCTSDRDGLFPHTMYYGKVVHAEVEPNSPYWKIFVKPAIQFERLRTVSVLRKSMNPMRLAGK